MCLPTSEEENFLEQMDLSDASFEVIEGLTDAGMRPMLVGGMVRDTLLGRPSKDVDIEVHAGRGGAITVDDVLAVAERMPGFRASVAGASFAVVLVTHRETGESFDLSLPRADSKSGTGHQGFSVAVDSQMGVQEAARRRDLTINAMSVDATTGELVDPFDGASDIENETLRVVDAQTFADDPLRVLRVGRFASQLGFSVAPQTMDLCRRHAADVQSMSGERVWGEVQKSLMSGSPGAMVAFLRDSGTLDALGSGRTVPDPAQFDRAGRNASALADTDRQAAVLAAGCSGLTKEQRHTFVTSLSVPESVVRTTEALSDARERFEENPSQLTYRRAQRLMEKQGRTTEPLHALDAVLVSDPGNQSALASVKNTLRAQGLAPGSPPRPLLDGRDAMAQGLRGREVGEALSQALYLQDSGQVANRSEAMAAMGWHEV